jgi:hypothetical protein
VDARFRVLALLNSVVLEPHRADDERQREALAHEGGEDDREGQEEDQVSARERRAGVRLER